MKKMIMPFTALVLVTCLVGCERDEDGKKEKQAVTSVAPTPMATVTTTATPSVVPTLIQETPPTVSITLEPRGYLKAPVKTLVADTPQTYSITFSEDMDRGSVQLKLLKFTPLVGSSGMNRPEIQFKWSSAKKLDLVVTTKGDVPGNYPLPEYTIDVNGALTSSGNVLMGTPVFRALVRQPEQLWRISAIDGHSEKVSAFTEPVMLQPLQETNYMLATQFLDYCECDRELPLLSSIYNVESGQLITYPVPLKTQYKGSGDFVADTRGFFYAQPKEDVVVPASKYADRVHIDGYVHGAAFSHDQKRLLLAVGKVDQDHDLDFVIYDLTNKQSVILSKKLVGQVPDNEVSSAKVPIQFHDDGTTIYTFMKKDQNQGVNEYRYSWASGVLEAWLPPVSVNAWSGFIATDDGEYRSYYNGGLYRGNERVQLPKEVNSSQWLHGSHRLIYLKPTNMSVNSPLTINTYNVDDHTTELLTKLPANGENRILGSSADGAWVYVASNQILAE